MTSAFQREPSYAALRQGWLGRYLLVEDKAVSAIKGILFDAAQDSYEQIKDLDTKPGIGAKSRAGQLVSTMKIIREINHGIFKQMGPVIRNGQKDAAEAAVDAFGEHESRALNLIFNSKDDQEDWLNSQRHSAALGVANVISRYLHSTIPLSRRVYRSRSLSNGYVERVINSAIVKGDSSRDIAKKVREHILPSTPGGISYAAMRLGRTELNNAFHATTIAQAENRPWVEYLQWNLSRVHEPDDGDLCETYARQGNFPVGQTPRKPHPQCRCFCTPVLTDWDAFVNNAKIGMYDDFVSG